MNIQDLFPLRLISLLSKGLSRVFSSTTKKNINSSRLSLLYGPTLISIHDYWKNHSFEYRDHMLSRWASQMAQMVKNPSTCNEGDLGLIPGLGRSSEEGNSYLYQYFCLENSTDRGAWQPQTPHGITKSRTWLSDIHFHFTSMFVIAFLPRSRHLLIKWLQSSSTVILKPKKRKIVTPSTFPPSVWHEMMDLEPWSQFFEGTSFLNLLFHPHQEAL